MYPAGEFASKTVVITGAASGVGRATALAYGKVGAQLMLLDCNESGLQDTVNLLEGSTARVRCRGVDIGSSAQCREAIAEAVENYGGIDILCNVAGIIGFSSIGDITPDFWRRHFAVNLDGPFFLSQAALPHLLKSKGNIVNIASSAALIGEAYLVPYATTKAALVHMTKSMAMELIHQDVRVNAICPGAIETPIMDGQQLPEGINFDLISRFSPLRAASRPEEIADFILYVSSSAAKSLHGAALSIDGGITAG